MALINNIRYGSNAVLLQLAETHFVYADKIHDFLLTWREDNREAAIYARFGHAETGVVVFHITEAWWEREIKDDNYHKEGVLEFLKEFLFALLDNIDSAKAEKQNEIIDVQAVALSEAKHYVG